MEMTLRKSEDIDLGRLQNSLGFLLRLAQVKAYERLFAEVGANDVRPGEFSVLWVISRNPGIRQSLLCQRLMIKRAHMTKLVRVLEDKDLVSRRVPDDDRRAVELTLTREGEMVVKNASRWYLDSGEVYGDGLTGAEREQLMHLLRRFVGIEGRDA